MAAYAVELKPKAWKELRELPADVQRRLSHRIDALAADPRPAGCEKLRGFKAAYRIRTGRYRVVYEVNDELRLVEIARIGHRRDVNRGL